MGMQAVVDGPPPRSSPGPGALLVPIGIVVTLVGLLGDLVSHTFSPASHAHEELIVLGRGNNPWHLVLFAGVLLATVGGIRWAGRLRSEAGAVLGAAIGLLLVATVVLGGISGWKARQELASASTAGHTAGGTTGASGTGTSSASHAHDTTAAGGGTTAGDVGAVAAGEGGEGGSQFGGHSHGVAGPVTPEEQAQVDAELAAAKAATAKYKSIDRAKADGYIQVTQFIPGLGLHLVNLKIGNRLFDPLRPQLLLYMPGKGGSWQLAGVGYQLAHLGDTPPEGFPGGADVWHFHQNLCFLPGGSVTITPTAEGCKARSGYFQKETAWLLHAWIWKTNPNGVFTEVNPDVF
jgi:hypothetical protein